MNHLHLTSFATERDLRLAIKEDTARLPGQKIIDRPEFTEALDTLQEALNSMRELLDTQADRAKELKNCLERADELVGQITRWRDSSFEGYISRDRNFPGHTCHCLQL